MEPRTAEYIRDLTRKYEHQKRQLIDTAGELCNCAHCTAERAKKQSNTLTPCQQKNIRDSIIQPTPSNYLPELSSNPDDWFFAEKRRKGLF